MGVLANGPVVPLSVANKCNFCLSATSESIVQGAHIVPRGTVVPRPVACAVRLGSNVGSVPVSVVSACGISTALFLNLSQDSVVVLLIVDTSNALSLALAVRDRVVVVSLSAVDREIKSGIGGDRG